MKQERFVVIPLVADENIDGIGLDDPKKTACTKNENTEWEC